MKKIAVILTTLFLSACHSPLQSNQHMVGSDLDSHGCKASAGYQWSSLKQQCVRIFEQGIRLNPQDQALDQTLSAFVMFNSDQTQAELFMPGQTESLILHRQGQEGNYHWLGSDYMLSVWKGYVLKQQGKVLYHGDK